MGLKQRSGIREDDLLLALRMQEGATSQGIQVAPGAGKSREWILSEILQEETDLLKRQLDF